ncbi:MAG: ATP-dependent helicase C-terminal domain-containing protein, partial [Thiohalocapsa sp.]
PYLIVANLDASSGDNRIRAALPVSEAELCALMTEQLQEVDALAWDRRREAVSARKERRLGSIVLESRPQAVADADAALELLLEAIGRDIVQALNWTSAARQLQARAMLARQLQPDADWPDLSNDWLAAHIRDWLGAWLTNKTRLSDARALDLIQVLKQILGWQRASNLDKLAPEMLTTPAGTRRRIDYCATISGDSPAPVLAAPMQELFGASDTPAIFDGRLPLLLHLLSPARRPLQVTGDLAGFWRGAYAEVRKEMRGRYPKHHWPEDPAGAVPVGGGLQRHTTRA